MGWRRAARSTAKPCVSDEYEDFVSRAQTMTMVAYISPLACHFCRAGLILKTIGGAGLPAYFVGLLIGAAASAYPLSSVESTPVIVSTLHTFLSKAFLPCAGCVIHLRRT